MSRWIFPVMVALLLLPAAVEAQTSGLEKGSRTPRLIATVPPRVEPIPLERAKEPPQPAVPNPPSSVSPPGGERDLFRAAPGTFDPRFDRVLTPAELGVWFPQSATVWPVWVTSEPQRRAGDVRPIEQTVRIIIEHRQAPPAAVPPPAPAVTLPAATVPLPPGHKRTLYVIPGCYAGDKPPRRDQLRPGCDMRNVRTISPAL